MKVYRLYFWVLPLLALLSVSCIRDEVPPCPPLKVMIDVKDKNYFNIESVERLTGLDKAVDENLPFRSYVKKLFYVLYDAATGNVVVERHLHDVEGDSRLATAYIPEDLPFGKYVMVVWGNIDSETAILDDGKFTTYNLHMGGVEGYDVYMTSDTLVYDYAHADYTVSLERVKGKLLIEAVGFPEDVVHSEKVIRGVSDYVNNEFEYSPEPAVLTTEYDWPVRTHVLTDTYLAPAVKENGVNVGVTFFSESSRSDSSIKLNDVNVDMNRNEITVMRYNYDEISGSVEVSVLLNDGWDVVNHMDVE